VHHSSALSSHRSRVCSHTLNSKLFPLNVPCAMRDSVFKVSCHSWKVQGLPFLFSLTAFCLSAAASGTCRFLLLETVISNTSYYVGLFKFMTAGGDNICRDLGSFTQGGGGGNDDFATRPNEVIFKIAMSAGIVAPLMGGIATFLFFLSFCRKTSKCKWCCASGIFLGLATIGQIGTFTLFGMSNCGGENNSDMRCSISAGAARSIAAIVLYFLTAILSCIIPAPRMPLISFVYDELPTCDHENCGATAPTNAPLKEQDQSKDSQISRTCSRDIDPPNTTSWP